MSIPRFFAKQTVLVNLLMLVILVAGIFSLKTMAVENNPAIDMDSAVVVIGYPGASPEDMEKLVTLPMEDYISTLPDIDFIVATSQESRASFFIQYEVGLDNFDQAFLDLRAKIEEAKPQIPEDARDQIYAFKIATDELWPVINVVIGGNYSSEGINRIADSLKEDLLKIEDVGSVEIYGIRNREIWVEADPSKLSAYKVALRDISLALEAANINLPAGRMEMGREEFLVRSMGEVTEPAEIGKIIVKSGPAGEGVRVRDLAEVRDTFERDEIVSRLDGNASVSLRVFMKRDGSVVDIVDEVKSAAATYEKNIPDISLTTRNDASKDVRESVSVLSTNAMTGLVLVLLLMTITIGLRSAILAIIGIPFAFLTAFIFLHATGGTINTLSLFAFILVLGLIVDDAIIIIENVYRHMEEGKSPLKAAIEGSEQVMWPVVAAILTTIAAFLPLLLMEGVIGKFMAVLPIVVVIALLGSLVQSLVVLPSHLSDFGRVHKKKGHRRGDKIFDVMSGAYRSQLKFLLKHAYAVTIGIFIATVIVTVAAVSLLRIEMFPPAPSSVERLLVRLPTGTKLDETNRVVEEIEKRIGTLPANEIESISSLTGLIIENYRWIRRSDGGMVTVELGDAEERRSNDEIKNDIRKLISDMPEIKSAYFSASGDGPPTGSPIEMRVRGHNLDKMRELSKMLMEDLRSIKGVMDVKSDFQLGKKEVRFIPDRMKMSAYGLTMAQLALIMRTAVEGLEVTKFRDDEGDEVKVRVMYAEKDRNDMDDLKRMIINTPLGLRVPLSELGEFDIERGAASIARRDRMRSISITANVNRIDVNSDEANRIMREKHKDFSTKYPGFNLDFGGEAEEQAKSFSSLLSAFVVAMILIYLILGTQFQSFTQPLVVMYTVPFSLLGVCIGLIVMNLTFSLVAGISVVALAGIVVNDSLVLVDFVNKARAQGAKLIEALVMSGLRRMRPIILTTITTIAGLLPMATGIGGSSDTWQPMAICMIWGLAFATFLTLFVIPCAYLILDNWVNYFRRKLGMQSTSELMQERAELLKDDTVSLDESAG